MVGIADFDIVINLNVTGSYHAWAFLAQGHFGLFLAAHDQRYTLQVQKDFDDIFLYAFNRAVLMQHTIDLSFSDGTTRHG